MINHSSKRRLRSFKLFLSESVGIRFAFSDAHLGGPAVEVESPEVEGELGDLLVVAETPIDLVPLTQALHFLHLGWPAISLSFIFDELLYAT